MQNSTKSTKSGMLTITSILFLIGFIPNLIGSFAGWFIFSTVNELMKPDSVSQSIESFAEILYFMREVLFSFGAEHILPSLDEFIIFLQTSHESSGQIISTTVSILLKDFINFLLVSLLLHSAIVYLQLAAGILGLLSYKRNHLLKYCKIFGAIIVVLSALFQALITINVFGFNPAIILILMTVPILYLIGTLIVKIVPNPYVVNSTTYYP